MQNINEKLYRKMYLIRSTEQKIIEHYFEDKMKTPMHMSMGEEAIICAVVESINPKAQAFGTFRSHALYLAMSGESEQFFRELHGKQSSIANGKTGSMHLSCPEMGFWGSSAIVASSIPLSIGVAFANKVKCNGAITACFFGDGAVEEGVFWETLNIACLMSLPVLFVYQDNRLAVNIRPELRKGYDSFQDLVKPYKCILSDTGDSTDAQEIYSASCNLISEMKIQNKPGILCTSYYRYLEHVGVSSDLDKKYRRVEEYEAWRKKDPVAIGREKLTDATANKIEKEIDQMVEHDYRNALIAPFPEGEELWKGVYAE